MSLSRRSFQEGNFLWVKIFEASSVRTPLAGQRAVRYPDGPTVRLYLDTKHCYLIFNQFFCDKKKRKIYRMG